jgi:hypothetical protein
MAKVGYDKGTGNIVATVGPAATDAWVAWFIQAGKRNVHWGDYTNDFTEPYPFVTMAGRNTQQAVNQKIGQHVKDKWEDA